MSSPPVPRDSAASFAHVPRGLPGHQLHKEGLQRQNLNTDGSVTQRTISAPPETSSAGPSRQREGLLGGSPGEGTNQSRGHLASPQQDSWVSPEESWAQLQLTPSSARAGGAAAAKNAAAAAAAAKQALAESAAAAAAAGEAAAAAAAAAAADAVAAKDAAELVADLEAADIGDNDFNYVFIFTNPTSGGNKAAAFTRTAVSRLTLREPFKVMVFINDIREGTSGSKPGFLLLKAIAEKVSSASCCATADEGKADAQEALKNSSSSGSSSSSSSSAGKANKTQKTIRVLVAGGDGTVMWCLEEMEKTGVLGNVCAVGVVPYGTGNDFANAFGWRPFNAANPFDSSLHTLRSIVEHSMRARVVFHDLWSVTVSLRPGGHFSRINPHTRKKEVVERGGEPVRQLSFTMSNYFTFAFSVVATAFYFQRYGIEGFKKTFLTRTKSINDIMLNLRVHPNSPQEEILCTTDKSKAKHEHIPLLKKTASLVLLNIPSFSGGNDIWGPSRKLATTQSSKQKQKEAKALLQVPQQMGDERLEFMTFRSVPSMGMEFLVRGRGSRLHSGGGPWDISFRPLDEGTRVYFQTDGEYYQLSLPSSVSVSHNRRVQVLSLTPERETNKS
ncbi:diacylglycerol kinase, putative [Eimeria maxima]|uniref:diacylglycerol kinase (ATP) n=1 Tax=Eimeria maxima TaxID=5804 RepID=U6M5G6_EIMMA|nr:diacylglycerol kinase, putative [Eimeria maxima]CDJ57679.1 diacylglycerol kinase, putative [Eimeria maxima]